MSFALAALIANLLSIGTDPRAVLVSGCTGGITGGGRGVSVSADGRIEAWQQKTFDSKTRTIIAARVDPGAARRLFSRLEASGFWASAYRVPANVTCSLSVVGARAHSVDWPMGQRPKEIIKIVALADDVSRAGPSAR